jgi:hypothetical protein
MNDLKLEAEKEQEEFEKEWNKLGRLIEKDKQVKDFIKTQEEQKNQQANQGQSGAWANQTQDVKTIKQETQNELANTEESLKK